MSRARGNRGVMLCIALLLIIIGGNLQAGELEDRFNTTLKRAEGGDAASMYGVGEMYELGMGTASDKTKAMNWYRAAADKGHPEGIYQIGYAYYWGKFGFTKDRRQAHVWFLRAAEAGSQAAMPYLAKMYSLGQGVQRDKEQAAIWSARAAQASSALLSQPPAPEVSRTPAPPPASAPAPAPATVTASPQAPPAAKPGDTARPPAAERVDRKQQQMARLLGSWWQKDGRPALYLPSSQTDCSRDGDEGIACQSQPRRSSLLGRPYSFHFKAYLETFDNQGRFAMRYWPEIIEILPAPPGAYGEDNATPPTEEEIRARVERGVEELSCEMFRNTHMTCVDDRGGELNFQRVDKGQAATPAVERKAALVAGSDTGTDAVPPPAPAVDKAEALTALQEEEEAGRPPRFGQPVGRR